MKKFDQLDRKLLYLLDGNSRQSLSDLAKTVGQGRDRVKYRIDRFLEQGIITRFCTVCNHAKLGLTIYKSYLRISNDSKRVSELLQYLKADPTVYWVALCDGSWDLMFSVVSAEPRDFYMMHQQVASKFNDIILAYNIYTTVDISIYRRSYFYGQSELAFHIGGSIEDTEIDELDFNLLKFLSGNARSPVTEIAEHLNSTPAIISYRIKKLEDAGVIIGYGISRNLSKLGMVFFKTQLFFQSHNLEEQAKFELYCQASPHITYYVQQLGDSMHEIELEVDDYQQYHQIMDELRMTFPHLIRNYTTVLLREESYKWVPQEIRFL